MQKKKSLAKSEWASPFKRWQGWALSKVLREWILNEGSKARETVKAMKLVFVLLDFQHGCQKKSVVYKTDCRHVVVQRGKQDQNHLYHWNTYNFIFNTFWNGKPVQFFQQKCWMVMVGCRKNESCSKVLIFLERLDDRNRCTYEETVAVVKPWDDIASNKSLGCIFSEKPVDWNNTFKTTVCLVWSQLHNYGSSSH